MRKHLLFWMEFPLLLGLAFLPATVRGQTADHSSAARIVSRIPVKVVVVGNFESGEDMGDTPGEFQLWANANI